MSRSFPCLVVGVLLSVPAFGATTSVTPENMGGWIAQTGSCAGPNTGTMSFVTGPAMAPLGVGAAQLTVGTNGDAYSGLGTAAYDGVLLSALTSLSYSTFTQIDGSGGQSPHLVFNVDYDDNGVIDDQLYFEPIYQDVTFFPSHPQGPLGTGTWQTWDALNGGWWSANNTAGASPGANVKTLATIIATKPGARIRCGSCCGSCFRVMTGCGGAAWANYIGNFDNVNVEVSGKLDTWDFEPTPTISIAALSENEGNAGASIFNFVVSLSHGVSYPVGFQYTTFGVTATVTDGDYAPTSPVGIPSPSVVFTPFQTTVHAPVTVYGDVKLEADETFWVLVFNVAGAMGGGASAGMGTILNDDAAAAIPTLSEWALLALVGLLSVFSVLQLRRLTL